MTKYKEYVKRMLEAEKQAFDSFKVIHDKYALNEDSMQDDFNKAGESIMLIVNEWENRLCKQSEKGGFSQYTPKLAEKFQEEVKKHFPLIDHVGIKVSYQTKTSDTFSLKKINL